MTRDFNLLPLRALSRINFLHYEKVDWPFLTERASVSERTEQEGRKRFVEGAAFRGIIATTFE